MVYHCYSATKTGTNIKYKRLNLTIKDRQYDRQYVHS